MRGLILGVILFGALASDTHGSARRGNPPRWTGTWTWDLCHEDRKADHDRESFCRQGRDRVQVAFDAAGRVDLTLCPTDTWGEKGARVSEGGRRLAFRSREGLEIQVRLGADGDHFSGRFISRDGHSGFIRGRRVSGCGG